MILTTIMKVIVPLLFVILVLLNSSEAWISIKPNSLRRNVLFGKKDKRIGSNAKPASTPTKSEKQSKIDKFDAVTRKYMVNITNKYSFVDIFSI